MQQTLAADDWARYQFAQSALATLMQADCVGSSPTEVTFLLQNRGSWANSAGLTAWGNTATVVILPPVRIVTPADLRFRRLRDEWRAERPISTSSIAKTVMSPSYQQIIGMGSDALRPILAELANQEDPEHWFWALAAISGENPVQRESRGNTRAMARAWLAWGREKGYVA